MCKRLICFVFIMVLLPLWGQERERVLFLSDTLALYKLDMDYYRETGTYRYQKEDSTFDEIRRLDPAFNAHNQNVSLGNMGTSLNPIAWQMVPTNFPQTGFISWNPYQFLPENRPIFLSPRPFTNLTYQLGSNSEHYFKVLHTQQINEKWLLGIEYRHINSRGTYRRQDAVHHNGHIFSRYLSKNKRYKVGIQFFHNAFTIQENGGLVNDSNFIMGGLFSGGNLIPNLNRATYPIHLNSAQRQGFNNAISASQQYAFQRRERSDSSDTKNTDLFILSHHLTYRNGEDRYSDKEVNNPYYGAILWDSTQSLHRLQWETLMQEVSLRFLMNAKSLSGSPIRAGLRHMYYRFIQRTDTLQGDTLGLPVHIIQNEGNHVEVFGSLNVELGRFEAKANASLVLSGYNSGGLELNASLLALPDSGKHTVLLEGLFAIRAPELLLQSFSSNVITWNTTLNKQQFLWVGALWEWKKRRFSMGAGSWLVSNFAYFDGQWNPTQDLGTHSILSGKIKKKFQWGPLDLALTIHCQYSSTRIIPLPLITGHSDLGYERRFFKNNLLLRIGIDGYYFSPFLGQGYDPLTGRFFVQDNKETGGYPFADLYIAARIRQVRFWVKLRNANQGIPSIPYFLTPGHPMQDRSIQFGIQWNMYN
jgi:hypothetical protein